MKLIIDKAVTVEVDIPMRRVITELRAHWINYRGMHGCAVDCGKFIVPKGEWRPLSEEERSEFSVIEQLEWLVARMKME